MKKLLLVTVSSLFLAGCFHEGFQSGPATSQASPTPQTESENLGQRIDEALNQTEVDLDEQNESGQSGAAVLREVDGKVVVTVTMEGEVSELPQPAHLHVGACPNPGAVKYPLNNVVDGASTTTLDVGLETLQEETDDTGLALNIHKSAQQANVYVACGDL